MVDSFKPDDPAQVLDVIKFAAAEEMPLEVIGSGSKKELGRPVQSGGVLDLSALSGITFYDPGELVLTALPGTPMAEIEAALEEGGQELAFEPQDLTPLLRGTVSEGGSSGTIGGVIAANLSGPRRIKSGAARDHLLGFQAISGRGETFKSGGRVMKNVTGFDLSKLVSGSFGTLAALTEITVKVLPRSEKTRTVLVLGLDDNQARQLLSDALGSSHEVAGAAHLPAGIAARSGVSYVADAGASVTAVRVEGPGPSVEHRCDALRNQFREHGEVEELHSHNSRRFWREIRDVHPFTEQWSHQQVWRISCVPTAGPGLAAALAAETGGTYYFDWGGGLIWLSMEAQSDAAAATVRHSLAQAGGGHATLVRAAPDVRLATDVFEPNPGPLAELSKRVKDAFDPHGVLNPGKMVRGI
jgi:glycolate oxidase FAD binding subunit